MFGQILENVRKTKPLIHNITNYVTVNDCANIILACGGSPIMADDQNEVYEITSKCEALNINIGTLNSQKIPSMIIAGKCANKLDHPVLFDPVGVGASKFRIETAMQLLEEIHFSVIRGNISEMKTLAKGKGSTRGVDANLADQVTEENLDEIVAFAKQFSKQIHAIIAITGAIDIVTDGKRAYCIRNGHSMMASVTGTGCQLSALMTTFLAANPSRPLEACAAAISAMGYAGEIAYQRLTPLDGNLTYRNYLIDAIYNMTSNQLDKGENYEMR